MSSATQKKPPHPVDIHVGKRLRFRRKTLGLSQADLGKQVGITFQQIQKYERGTNRMGASRLWECALALQVPVDYFFHGCENDGSQIETSLPDMSLFDNKETQTLVRFFYRIPDPKLRKSITALIRTLSDDAT